MLRSFDVDHLHKCDTMAAKERQSDSGARTIEVSVTRLNMRARTRRSTASKCMRSQRPERVIEGTVCDSNCRTRTWKTISTSPLRSSCILQTWQGGCTPALRKAVERDPIRVI